MDKKLNMILLEDKDTYRKLSGDPTQKYQLNTRGILDRGMEMVVLTFKMANKLFPPHPTIPLFHSLPKIHKDPPPPPR